MTHSSLIIHTHHNHQFQSIHTFIFIINIQQNEKSIFIMNNYFNTLDLLKNIYHILTIKQIFEFKTFQVNKTYYEITYKAENCL